MNSAIPLEMQPKKMPQQGRAIKSFNMILQSTLEIMEKVGLDGLNTNTIAEHANVNVSVIYKYFPNKFSILCYLAFKLAEEQVASIDQYLRAIDPNQPWQDVCDGIIEIMIESSLKHPGHKVLQKSLLTIPELRDAYRQTNLNVAKQLNIFLRRWGLNYSEEQLNLITMCAGESVTAVLGISILEGRDYEPELIEECKKVFKGYLSMHFLEKQ